MLTPPPKSTLQFLYFICFAGGKVYKKELILNEKKKRGPFRSHPVIMEKVLYTF